MKGAIIRRGKSSWRLKFDVGRAADGKRKIAYHTFRGIKKDAEAELVRLMNGANNGNYVDPSKLTTAQFLEQWDRDWASLNLSPKTIERYRELVRIHIAPNIGTELVQKLRPVSLSTLYAKLQRDGRAKGGGLAPRTVGHIHRIMHRALGHAMQWGIVSRNVASVVEPPKVVPAEMEILSADQVNSTLRTLRGAAMYPIVLTAFSTGMRRGEILALRWRDVNLDAAKIQVERSLEETKAGLRFKEPKTRHGRRNIALPSSLVAELRGHWRAQQELRLALGVGKAAPDDLVFCTPDGGPRKPNSITREWSRLTVAKKLPKVSFHALRHTHVSQLIASGMDVLTISRRIGHASPTITLGVYGHLFKNTDNQAALVIEAAFGHTLGE